MRPTWTAFAVLLILTACGRVLGLPKSTSHMVPMRDGVLLATDVYLPDAGTHPAPYPTILMRTTYGKDASASGVSFSATVAKPYVENGYAFVAQDTRGKHASAGIDSIFFTDGDGPLKDGYDTIEWITQQDWSNGDVGMTGMSALGITTYMAAAAGHPALKAAVLFAAASNLYDDVFYPGGVYRKNMVDRWVTGQGREDFLPFIWEHAQYDSIWQRVNLPASAAQSRAAIYHWNGWFDCMNQGQIEAFRALQYRGGAGARGKQMLVMGPWSHAGAGRTQGALRFPENIRDVNPVHDALPWFDTHLKGHATYLDTIPPVRYYLMGDVDDSAALGNRWMSAMTWPPEGVQEQRYFLHPDGLLVPDAAPDIQHAEATYLYDPADPVPTLGGLNLYKPIGPADLDSIETVRSDIVTFTTAPLEQPVIVTGKVRVRLYASSDRPDTDFMAMLSDVYPDGRSMLILDGALRARYRDSQSDPQFMEPGEVYAFDINLWDTAIVFEAGHRIRLNITSSNAPRFMPNPNTATPFRSDTVGVKARNTVRYDARYPSALILPVLPESSLRESAW